MKIGSVDPEKNRQQLLRDVKYIKVRVLRELDKQDVSPAKKCYKASVFETSVLLTAGADILEYKHSENYVLLRLMFEGVPVSYEAESEFTHPRLR